MAENKHPQLVVMLTYNDFTVADAEEVFDLCKNTKASFWGMKEKTLPIDRMASLFSKMRDCGKTTVLEVVTYDEEQSLCGAEMAARCGCDMLMGTKFHESVAAYCRNHDIRYMPFVGTLEGRPSVLTGRVEDMIAEAREVIANGAYGIDLLGYRYAGDAESLNMAIVEAIDAPVCIAGSIDSFERLDEIKRVGPELITVGSAFFDHRFGETLPEQIDCVCEYLEN